MEVRKATTADLPEVHRLYRLLNEDMAALQPEDVRPADQEDAFLRQSIREEVSDILLAVEGAAIRGFALVQLRHTPPYTCIVPYTYAYLLDLVVDTPARGQGGGRLLLAAVKAWAKERGAAYVELQVYSRNTRAQRLYQREGFGEQMRTLRCGL